MQRLLSSYCRQSKSPVQVQEETPELHIPLAHESPLVHRLPSSQGPVLGAQAQPLMASQLSVVHGLPSSQISAAVSAEPTQLPAWHVSLAVHGFLSLHGKLVGV